MKKNLFFYAAAAALMLTACTNEDDVVQTAQQTVTTAENEGAVGFDIYVPQSTTRSGRTNVMTNGTLQRTGFGIYGYQTENETTDFKTAGYVAGAQVPNYMWNQQVSFNTTAAGWYYAPLKYWPNETNKDSQTTPTQAAGMPNQTAHNFLDRLTFFAYAPWVKAGQSDGATSQINTYVDAPAGVGIARITNTSGTLTNNVSAVSDPLILYNAATNPNQSVDLLWGVAPAGGLSYTNVSGGTTTIPEGKPLIDLVKPAVNTNMKFMFQHALARLGVKVVLAADQVAAGGTFDYGNTKVTIESIVINGQFGTNGILNLNNGTANKANWISKNKADGSSSLNPVLTIDADHGLAPHLIYDGDKNTSSVHQQQEVTGVTTTLADAIKVSSTYDPTYPNDYVTSVTKPEYSPTTPYFAAAANVVTPTYAAYAPEASDKHYGATPTDSIYFHKFTTSGTYSSEAYTKITPNFTYPNATVWENIYALKSADYTSVNNQYDVELYSNSADWKAYKRVGDTWIPTGKNPEIGDWVVNVSTNKGFIKSTLAKTTGNYYLAKPNYFMVVPTNNVTYANETEEKALRTLKVKITYYVSTKDASLKDGIIYTKNVVEKDVVLPHLKNGVAYNLKLILGLTSVKVEAEVADWTTTEGVINLPQNTAE